MGPLGRHMLGLVYYRKRKKMLREGPGGSKIYNNRASVIPLSHDTLRPLPHKAIPADRRVLRMCGMGIWVQRDGRSCVGWKQYRRLGKGLSGHISCNVSISSDRYCDSPHIPGGYHRHKQFWEHS